MKIAFRAGPGRHRLARSLALASAMKETEQSSDVFFLAPSAADEALISAAGIRSVRLGAAGAWESDEAGEKLDEEAADMLVVDREDADESYLSDLHQKAFLAVFDDAAALRRYDADAIINPSLNAHALEYPAGTEAEFLLGTDFIPIPPSLDPFSEQKRSNPPLARKVVVCPGTDSLVMGAVNSLKGLGENFSATIALPAGFGKGEQLASEIGLDPRFISVPDPDPQKRFASSDMAISGPEFLDDILFFALPAVLVGKARSTEAEYAARNGLVQYLPEPDARTLSGMAGGLMADKEARDRMSGRMAELVDGLGRYRLASELLRILREGESL